MPDLSALEALESAKTDPAVLWVARECLRQCAAEGLWGDLQPDAVAELSDAQVVETIAGDWAGGFDGFLQDCAPDIAERRAETAGREVTSGRVDRRAEE